MATPTPVNYNAKLDSVNRITAHNIDINTILIRILHMLWISSVAQPMIGRDTIQQDSRITPLCTCVHDPVTGL